MPLTPPPPPPPGKKTSLWVETHRPMRMNDVLGQEMITKYLKSCVDKKSIPNLILHGDPGCGKTSTILALARDLYGESYTNHIHEFNASDDRGIGFIRTKIAYISKQTPKSSTGSKMIILDEADFLTNEAQAALRKIIEESSDKTIFCLMCNYVHKIIIPIQSRCMTFYFRSIPRNTVRKHLWNVCKTEGVSIPDHRIASIADMCKGDMRTAITRLQIESVLSHSKDSQKEKSKLMGCVIDKIYRCVMQIEHYDDPSIFLYTCIQTITDKAYPYVDVILTLMDRITQDPDNVLPERTKCKIIPLISNAYHNTVIGCNGPIHLLHLCLSIFDICNQISNQ